MAIKKVEINKIQSLATTNIILCILSIVAVLPVLAITVLSAAFASETRASGEDFYGYGIFVLISLIIFGVIMNGISGIMINKNPSKAKGWIYVSFVSGIIGLISALGFLPGLIQLIFAANAYSALKTLELKKATK